ncbi:hypothetical protein LCGC14_3075910, partial [marine sediment metagenome]
DGTYRVRADYGVVCEHDIENRRSMEISLLPATLHDIHEEAIGQIHGVARSHNDQDRDWDD